MTPDIHAAESFHEPGHQRNLFLGSDDDAHPAGELDAHLGVAAVLDLDLDELQVGDLSRFGDGLSSHLTNLGPDPG